MVKINEIARTSTFAWSLDSLPLLATGTVAGAVDVNFSSSASLEVWDTFSATNKDEPIFSAAVDNRFYALAWSRPFEGRPKGLICGAFENGVVEFWDAEVLIKSKSLEKSSVHKSTKHTGPVRSLAFNPLQDHVLVSGGSNGQIFIWDTKKFGEPFSPGQAMTPMDEVGSVAWNNSVSHILASTGGNGYTSIWDLKSKREVLHLSYSGPSGRASFSHVAWHPTQSTKLITASDSDSCPLILTWDLRNSNEPEMILEGHKKGVLSLDWCKQDPELLISSGKDNTTFLWNPVKGTKLGEYPTTANWAFQTKFAPAAPDIFATASFDGKIVVQSLQDTSPPVSAKVTSTDDSVFWNQISTTETQQPVFQVNQAPLWLKRPVSVTFGFGSKIVTVKDQDGKSTVNILKLVIKGQESHSFDALKSDDYKAIIESKLEKVSNDNDKSDWELLKKLSEGKDDILREITNEEKEEKPKETTEEPKETAEEPNEDFFDKLGNGHTASSSSDVNFSGSFDLIDSNDSENKVIKLILNNKIEQAVQLCLDQDKLVEALILSLDSSDSIKQKVRNVYFKKNEKSQFSRVVHDISTNNIADIVSNASVSNWKEIASSIVAFSSDPQDLHHRISELGDRILNSDDKHSRTNAITCYLAGNALDKIANIWLKELPDFELELLKSNNADITSPAEARLEALTNFVLKIVTYRTITNETGVLSGPSVEAISKAILEYANLVAGYGEFDLAEKFLKLLPAEYAGSEKDRISKASGKVATKTARNANYSRANEKVSASIPPVTPGISTPGIPTPGYPTPAAGFQPAAPKPFANGSPAASAAPGFSAASAPGISATPAAGFQPAAASNPYARPTSSNPYAPASNIYKPAQPAQPAPGGVISPPPVAPSKPYKKDTEGWNDLPDTFKPKAAPRRAAPAAVVAAQPAAPFSPGPQVAPGPPKRPGSTASVPVSSVVPPPPKIGARTASSISTPSAPQSPRQAPVHLNNRYAPPPGSAEPAPAAPPLSSNPSFGAPSASAPPKKNPYAPPEGATSSPARVAYAPPPVGNVVPPNGIGSPSVGRSSISAPPKNPYAPPAGRSGSLTPLVATPPPPLNTFAPPPNNFAPPPLNNFAPPPSYGASTPPVQPPFTSIPPPPRTPSIGQHSAPSAPPAGPPLSAPSQSASQPVQPAQPAKPQYPAGDRSHIPEKSLPIYETFTEILTAIKPVIPEKFARHAQDMETRLNYLFDHLNNDDLLSDETIESLKSICSSLKARDFPTAAKLNVEVATKHADELGNWHTGVKRLITMSEAMY